MINSDITFREKRLSLIHKLKQRGINDEKVLHAMSILPREEFVLSTFINKSYDDNALPIDCEQTISQPFTVAYMTSLLNVQLGEKILEIGTGSGYQAALLALLGAEVYSIERHKGLYQKSMMTFTKLGLKVEQKLGDGTLGWQENAPFDKIIVTAAAPKIPENLKNQLKVGGVIVIPVGDLSEQEMIYGVKDGSTEFTFRKYNYFKFVPMIGEEGWK